MMSSPHRIDSNGQRTGGKMTAAGFAALLEVSTLSVALTLSCIVGFRFGLRCILGSSRRSSSSFSSSPSSSSFPVVDATGLSASLVTAFFCVYGLTYWFNGIGGYECLAFSVTMGTSVSVSNALAFLHLFMLSNSPHQISARWKSFRWLGLLLTAFYWGALAAAELSRTAEEQTGGESSAAAPSSLCIGGLRCVSDVNDAALSVKWVAQLLNQIFLATAFLLPLRNQVVGAAKARSFSRGFKTVGDYRNTLRLPVWQIIISQSVSLLMTTAVAALALAKAQGRLDTVPMFAVEILDNAVNLAAIFYAVHAMPGKLLNPKNTSSRLLLGPGYPGQKARSLNGSFGRGGGSFHSNLGGGSGDGVGSGSSSSHGFGGGYGRGGSRGGSPGGLGRPPNSSSNIHADLRFPRPHSLGTVSGSSSFSSFSSSSLQRRYNSCGPIQRLPPVLDMSPGDHHNTNSSGHGSAFGSSRSRSSSSNDSDAAPSPSSPPPSVGIASPLAPIVEEVGVRPGSGEGDELGSTPGGRCGRPARALYFSRAGVSCMRMCGREGLDTYAPIGETPHVEYERFSVSIEKNGLAYGQRSTEYSKQAKSENEPGRWSTEDRRATTRPAKKRWTPLGSHSGVASDSARGRDNRLAFTAPQSTSPAAGAGAGALQLTPASAAGGNVCDVAGGGVDANPVPSRGSGTWTKTIMAAPPEAAGGEHNPTAAALAGANTDDALSSLKRQQEEWQQELTLLPRPVPSNTSWMASSIVVADVDGIDVASGGGYAEDSRAMDAPPAVQPAEPDRSEANSSRTALEAAAAAANNPTPSKVVWPLPIPSQRTQCVSLPARALALTSSAAKIGEAAVDRKRTAARVAAETAESSSWRWQQEKTQQTASRPEPDGMTPASRTGDVGRASAAPLGGGGFQRAGVSLDIAHVLPVFATNDTAAPAEEVGPTAAAPAAAPAAAAGPVAKRALLEKRSSSSATCHSGFSESAWSAFSAASWCSSSFDGDETPCGAPAATVRSPASYHGGAVEGFEDSI
ncbi:unnamed protein product [Pylaiella littoralis]